MADWPEWLSRTAVLAAALALGAAPARTHASGGVDEVIVDGQVFPDIAPLPQMPYPPGEPPDARKEALGRRLLFEKRLSGDGRLACAGCHVPDRDFSDGLDVARARGKRLLRRTPSLKNAAFQRHLFWDGRARTLQQQFVEVLTNPDEMAADPEAVVARLRAIPEYEAGFREAFGGEGLALDTLGRAVAAYERTLRVADTPYDRYLRGEHPDDFSPREILGLRLFRTKARCIVCHNGPTLSDGKFHNTGLRPRGHTQDLGRQRVDGSPASFRQFRTPMLRNSGRLARFMHDGSMKSVEEVIEFYDRGGEVAEGRDPLLKPLHLTRDEKLALKSLLDAMSEKADRGTARYADTDRIAVTPSAGSCLAIFNYTDKDVAVTVQGHPGTWTVPPFVYYQVVEGRSLKAGGRNSLFYAMTWGMAGGALLRAGDDQIQGASFKLGADQDGEDVASGFDLTFDGNFTESGCRGVWKAMLGEVPPA